MKLISRRSLLQTSLPGGIALLVAACKPAQSTQPDDSVITDPPLPAPTAARTPYVPPELADEHRMLKAVVEVKQIARLTGEASINDTPEKWGLFGTDLGSMFDKNGKLYMVFGDSFGCCIPGTGGPGNAADWRYNCMAVINDREPEDGLTFESMISDRPRHAKQIIPRGKFDKTLIPTYGVSVGDRMFLHYMAVLAWGNPGEWTLNESGLAFSDDNGQTWAKDQGVKWDGKSNFGQVAFVKDETHVYLFGIPGGRLGGVKLARVAQAKILELAEYEYFSGLDADQPIWSHEEPDAVPIVPAPVGELSVIWNSYLGRWIMTYLDETQQGLVIREAPNLWGPWSRSLPLVSGSQFPGLYGAYMHPWYVENEGQEIYFAMSQWGPYSVFWMRARLEKAARASLFGNPTC